VLGWRPALGGCLDHPCFVACCWVACCWTCPAGVRACTCSPDASSRPTREARSPAASSATRRCAPWSRAAAAPRPPHGWARGAAALSGPRPPSAGRSPVWRCSARRCWRPLWPSRPLATCSSAPPRGRSQTRASTPAHRTAHAQLPSRTRCGAWICAQRGAERVCPTCMAMCSPPTGVSASCASTGGARRAAACARLLHASCLAWTRPCAPVLACMPQPLTLPVQRFGPDTQ